MKTILPGTVSRRGLAASVASELAPSVNQTLRDVVQDGRQACSAWLRLPRFLGVVALALMAQPSPLLAEPNLPDPPVTPAKPVPSVTAVVPATPRLSAAAKAKPKARAVVAQVAEPLDPELFAVGDKVEDVLQRADLMFSRSSSSSSSSKGGRTLVIPSGAPDAAGLANANEDLAVMARVLQKAVAQVSGDSERKKAMGIELRSLPGSSSSFRNLYVEGYGALFVLNVRFPLLPLPEKKESASAKEPTSTEWEEAWKETFGSGGGDIDVDRGFRQAAGGTAVEYDAQKVEDLKTALLEALKNATHIRGLKPEETITLMVLGAEERTDRVAKVVTEPGGQPQANVFFRNVETRKGSAARGESVLLMRVKKSDVDAFAKSKGDLEEFRKKATVLTYLTGDRASSGAASRP